MQVFGYTMTVPKYLVIAVTIYSVLLSVAMAIIGRRLVGVIAVKNAAEAQFRAVGSHLHERGTSTPSRKDRSSSTVCCQDRWMTSSPVGATCLFSSCAQRWYPRATSCSAPVIAWWLCAPKYLVGTMSLGEVAQVTAAFVIVQAALNWLVENYAGVADCLSSVNRVASFLIALDELDHDETAP